jgi:hypothetical protein
MSNIFNLNIENYNQHELEDLFDLVKPYDEKMVENSKEKIEDKLLQDKNLGNEKKDEVAKFLENVASKLIDDIPLDMVEDGNVTNFMQKRNNIIESGSNVLISRTDALQALNADSISGRIIDSHSVPPGVINPINVRSIKKAINIDSRFRTDYYDSKSTDYLVTIPTDIKKVLSISVASLDIPLTFYAVSREQGNNTFVIRDINGAAGPWVCHLPDGNYETGVQDATNAFHINLAVNNAMRLAGVPEDLVYTVDPISGRSVFASKAGGGSVITAFTIDFNVDYDGNIDQTTNLQLRLGWSLGFRTATYIAAPPSGPAAVTSEGICYMKGPRYAYLGLKDFNNNTNNYFISAFSASILSPDIIARINLKDMQQGQGVYNGGSSEGSTTQLNRTRYYFGPVDLHRFRVSLYDEYGRILELNNMDWSFTLSFECLYD